MESVLSSLGKCIYNTNDHHGYIIQWNLISPLCKKWSRNRDADITRVNEMILYHTKGGYIPRIIHLAEIKDEGIVCYDGNHRREVFNKCSVEDDITCIVDIMFDTSQNEVYKAFNNINKCVQVPAIYIVEETQNTNTIKASIIELVKDYEVNYKQLLSSSSRCHAPNFNRDMLTENIYNIYKSFSNELTIDKIKIILKRLNNEYANGNMCRPHSSYKKNIIDKCKKYNMWLFIEKSIPNVHVEKLLE